MRPIDNLATHHVDDNGTLVLVLLVVWLVVVRLANILAHNNHSMHQNSIQADIQYHLNA